MAGAAEVHALLRVMKTGDLPELEQAVKQHNQGALEAYAEYLRGRTD